MDLALVSIFFSVKIGQGLAVVYSYMVGLGDGENNKEGLHSSGFCYRSEGQCSPPGGGVTYGDKYRTGDIIGVVVDVDLGRIEYLKNSVSQGIAFTDIYSSQQYKRKMKNLPVFPAVSLNNTGDNVTLLQYIPYKGEDSEFPWNISAIIKNRKNSINPKVDLIEDDRNYDHD